MGFFYDELTWDILEPEHKVDYYITEYDDVADDEICEMEGAE